MTFKELYGWVNNKVTVFIVSQGEITPVDADKYQALSIYEIPEGARLTTSYRTAAVLADYQKQRAVERS